MTAPRACAACATDNRPAARYCKGCGTPLPVAAPQPAAPAAAGAGGAPAGGDDPFARVVGLDDVVAELRGLAHSAAEIARTGGERLRLHSIVVGRTGTGKSLLADALAAECARAGLTTQPAPTRLSAVEFAQERDAAAVMKRARGGVLFIDEAHKLIAPPGAPPASRPLDRLVAEMNRAEYATDPIVVLAGLPGELREYRAADHEFRQRFPNVFHLPDLEPAVMCDMAARELGARGFRLADDARATLLARFRHIRDDAEAEYQNGHAVRREVERMINSAIRREAKAGTRPERVVTDVDVPRPVYTERSLDEILRELDEMVGMGPVRAFVERILATAAFKRRQAEQGGRPYAFDGHLILTGNPGTGKTTLARVLARIFGATGILPSSRLVEADRSKLVADVVGGTAKLVQRACDDAMGGVLFIDEAYGLKQSDGDNFGQEALDTLMKRVEDDRGKFVCILAGYPREMDALLDANPGLPRRFPEDYRLRLPDYTPDELAEIFARMAAAEGLALDDGARARVLAACRTMRDRATARFGNAGEVRNFLQRCTKALADRNRRDNTFDPVLRAADIVADTGALAQMTHEEAMAAARRELDEMVGLADVKAAIVRLTVSLQFEREERELGRGQAASGVHWTLQGNPGTGKTAVARCLGRIFYAAGLLPTDKVIEVTVKDLIGKHVGETPDKTNKVVDRAMGGVLFIDEAYGLVPGGSSYDYNQEAVDVLLKRMEDDRGKFVVIAAGYREEMQDFLAANAGLRQRFTQHLVLPDYDPAELTEIVRRQAGRGKMRLADGVAEALQALFAARAAAGGRTHGNARFARKLYEAMVQQQRVRLTALRATRALTDDDRTTLAIDDVPADTLSLV